MKRAEVAFRKGRILEARRWTLKALEAKPEAPQAQKLMAQVLDREIAREKSLFHESPPKDFPPGQRKLQIKTWIERSRSFLDLGQYDEALLAAEQVFSLDPENPEASRLIDQIKEVARRDGKGENLFLQELYQEEIETRIAQYAEQAEAWLEAGRFGAARLAIGKILILDPENPEGRRLLAQLNEQEARHSVSIPAGGPGGR